MLIVIFVVHTKWFIEFANSRLGRFVAIALIVIFTRISIIYGLFVCLLIIFFYQMDVMDQLHDINGIECMTSLFPHSYDVTATGSNRISNNTPTQKLKYEFVDENPDKPVLSINQIGDTKYNTEGEYVLEPKDNLKNTLLISSEVLSSVNNAEYTEPFTQISDVTTFQNQNCKHDKLMYKEFPVKREMAQHMFPEIQYKNDDICNLCDPNCEFAVNKINIEQKIVRESFVSLRQPVESSKN